MTTLFVSRGRRQRWSLALGCMLALGLPVTASVANSPTGQSVTAIWKAQRVNFEYRGDSTVYSCRSLQDKLVMILRTVGAREDVRLHSFVCDEQLGVARFEVAMKSPVIASEANVREATQHDSKDELIARVNGGQLPGPADLERFPAVWKTVSFARHRGMRLERGDCELVQQLRRQILPHMSVRVVKDNVRCSSSMRHIGAPRLTVLALVRAPD